MILPTNGIGARLQRALSGLRVRLRDAVGPVLQNVEKQLYHLIGNPRSKH